MRDRLKPKDIEKAEPKDGKVLRLNDGAGLYLEVRPSTRTDHLGRPIYPRMWIFRFAHGGKMHVMSFGNPDDISLKEARELRDAARKLVRQGIHPGQHRKAQRVKAAAAYEQTVQNVSEIWVQRKEHSWSPKYATKVRRLLELYVYPQLGKRPIQSLTKFDLRNCVDAVVKAGKPQPATDVLGRLRSIFLFAMAEEIIDRDPSIALVGYFKAPQVEHHPSIRLPLLKDLYHAFDEYPSRRTGLAAKLLMYTALRVSELVGGRWEEVDLTHARWVVPRVRMKGRKADHWVPLSKQAIAILQTLKAIAGDSEYVFPSAKTVKKHMQRRAVQQMFDWARLGVTCHGMRSTFSTLANEHGLARHGAIEKQLAHAAGDPVASAYNSALVEPSGMWLERQKLMQSYADLLDRLATGATVTELRPAEESTG